MMLAGGWVYLANWGSEWGADVDNFIDISNDLSPPLDYENVVWNTDITYDLSELSGFSSIRFSFGSDFVNGGWVLIDDVTITGTGEVDDASIFEPQDLGGLEVYPNPTNDILFVELADTKVDRVEVYSLLGEKVMDISLLDWAGNTAQLDLSTVQSGMYSVIFYAAEEKRYTNLVSVR